MNCCRALIINLQKVFYNSQASVGDRQYTIILFISIMFLPEILKGKCIVFKKKIIMDENDTLSEYNKIPLGHNRTNGAVYSKIYFKLEICSAH